MPIVLPVAGLMDSLGGTLLVTEDEYRKFEKDTLTVSDAITEALLDAQTLIEEYLRRPLALAERTEDMYVEWGGIAPHNGKCYPSATPITVVPDGYSISGDAILVSTQGEGIGDLPGPFWEMDYNPDYRTLITLTYTGGWTASNLPTTIKRAVAEAAFVLTRSVSSAVPQNAQSLRVGDVSVSYGQGGPLSSAQGSFLTKATLNRLSCYRRRFI